MADNSNRESARWAEALDRLVEWGWVKAVGYKGEIFEMTGTGYHKADWLKAGMEIDTSKDPLDELKEFESWYFYVHKVSSNPGLLVPLPSKKTD